MKRATKIIILTIIFCITFMILHFVLFHYIFNKSHIPDYKEKYNNLLHIIMLISFVTFGLFISIIYIKLEKTRNELIKSQKGYSLLIENASDAFTVIDNNGKFLLMNNVAAKYLNSTPENCVGKTIWDFLPKQFADEKMTIIKNIFKTGITHDNPELKINLNRKTKWFHVTSQPIIDNTNKVNSVVIISKDITERKLMNQRILNTIIETEEKERKRFADDLHDQLGVILSSIKIQTELLHEKCKNKPKEKEILGSCIDMINTAIETTKEIASNITPDTLHKFGLIEAISSFCNKIQKITHLIITFNIDRIDDDTIVDNIKTTLYRAVKEFINNTLKHADAKNIMIYLAKSNNNYIMTYKDDGKGFNVTKILGENTKTGGLANIIDRIKTIDGSIDVLSKEHNGTTIKVTF